MKRELIKTIPYNEVKFRWIRNHYDIHLNGTCIFNDNLCEFKNDNPDNHPDEDIIMLKIYKLDLMGKIKWYLMQWKFEMCIGYHWTMNKKLNAHQRGDIIGNLNGYINYYLNGIINK